MDYKKAGATDISDIGNISFRRNAHEKPREVPSSYIAENDMHSGSDFQLSDLRGGCARE